MSLPPRNDLVKSVSLVLTRVGGRFLTNLKYLGLALGGYAILTIATYGWLAIQFRTLRGKAATIAYDIATGGSPLMYVGDLRPSFPWLWLWISFFHVLAWIAMPVLIATTIDALYRVYEQGRIQAERDLRRRLRKHGEEKLKLSGATLDSFVEDRFETIVQLSKMPD